MKLFKKKKKRSWEVIRIKAKIKGKENTIKKTYKDKIWLFEKMGKKQTNLWQDKSQKYERRQKLMRLGMKYRV